MEAEESLQQPAAAVKKPRIETALDVSPQPHRDRIQTGLLTVIPAEEFVGLLLLLEHPPRSEMEADVLLERGLWGNRWCIHFGAVDGRW